MGEKSPKKSDKLAGITDYLTVPIVSLIYEPSLSENFTVSHGLSSYQVSNITFTNFIITSVSAVLSMFKQKLTI